MRAAKAPETMKAIVHRTYGAADVLRFEAVARPQPGPGEVLVRVRAAAVCRGDAYLLSGKPYLIRLMGYGVRRPKHPILGQDLAGRVEAMGPGVTAFEVGNEVYGQAPHGAFAEYACVPQERLALRPTNLTFEQTAAVPDSGLTALQGLRDIGGLKPGQRVLINGASGGVGTFAIQIARALGAEVTAVCSGRHIDTLRSLGAHHVIDYTRDDFIRHGTHDVLFDLVGNRSLADCKRVLTPRGTLVSCSGGPMGSWIGPIFWLAKVVVAGWFSKRKMTPFVMKPNRNDLLVLKEMIEAGKVRPVIERRFPLSEAAEGVHHVATGHAQGKTVITL